jgi:hypothetical protein
MDWTKSSTVGVKSVVVNGSLAIIQLSKCIKAEPMKVSRKTDVKTYSAFTVYYWVLKSPSTRLNEIEGGVTYRVFNVTSYSENNGDIVTINGDGSGDPVVSNFEFVSIIQ